MPPKFPCRIPTEITPEKQQKFCRYSVCKRRWFQAYHSVLYSFCSFLIHVLLPPPVPRGEVSFGQLNSYCIWLPSPSAVPSWKTRMLASCPKDTCFLDCASKLSFPCPFSASCLKHGSWILLVVSAAWSRALPCTKRYRREKGSRL